MGEIDGAIKSVVNEYHWSPFIINEMFLDDLDYFGVMYWYEEVKSNHEKLKALK